MRRFLYLFFVTWTVYMSWHPGERSFVSGQYWNITQMYTPIKFEMVHRGSFNLSQCSREMLNCWEIFPHTGVVCSHDTKYDSVCGLMRQFCTEYYPLREMGPYFDTLEQNQDIYIGGQFDINYDACAPENKKLNEKAFWT